MKIWEFLKFLAMLIPTWLLLAALAVTLSLPAKSGGEPSFVDNPVSHSAEILVADSELGPLPTVFIR